jgi:membrane protease YdiL (CAAX protease family)
MLYLGRYLPSLHPVLIAVIAGMVFGLGHVYQGWTGGVGTTIFGIVFGVLYWRLNGLVPLMVVHACGDLLMLWQAPAKAAGDDPHPAQPSNLFA